MVENHIIDHIKFSDRIAIFAHIMPDGDTLGSCLALGQVLRSLGKNVDLFCQDDVPPVYRFLKGIQSFQKYDSGRHYPLGIAIDCSDMGRMGKCADIFKRCNTTANIDHHISNTSYAAQNLVDSTAAASGELIYKLIVKLSVRPDKSCAEALYTAICTDTGSFSFSSTTSKTYRIAADLLDCDINVDYITTMLFRSNSLSKIQLLARVLNTLELYEDNRVAVLSVTRDMLLQTGSEDSDTENLVNYAKNIIGVELGVLLKEASDKTVKASFRSDDNIDVSKLAAVFGGGGHKKAAGASIHSNMGQAREAILEATRISLKELL